MFRKNTARNYERVRKKSKIKYMHTNMSGYLKENKQNVM